MARRIGLLSGLAAGLWGAGTLAFVVGRAPVTGSPGLWLFLSAVVILVVSPPLGAYLYFGRRFAEGRHLLRAAAAGLVVLAVLTVFSVLVLFIVPAATLSVVAALLAGRGSAPARSV